MLPSRVPLTGSALGWATAMGEVLVMVVMVAAGSIRVDMSTQLRIDLKIVYLYSGKQNKHTALWASLGVDLDKTPGGYFLDILCCK